jgi:hypothetical protein
MELSLIAVLLIGFFLTPAFWHPRYTFPILILGSLATAVVLEGLNHWARRLLFIEIVFLLLFSCFNTMAPYGVSSSDVQSFLQERNDQTRSSSKFITRENGGRAYEWIDQFTLDRPSTIAYGKQIVFVYALYGSDLRNRVVTVLPQTADDWRDSLERSQVELVLVLDWTPNYSWMRELQNFQEVYRDGQSVIFQRIS